MQGEGCASDAELLTLVSSANIACGFHAGDAQTMQACVREAIKKWCRDWRSPSFPTGKILVAAPLLLPKTVFAQTLYQIGAQAAITRAQRRRNVMSNRTACYTTGRRKRLQRVSPGAVYACDPALILVGLAGSELIRAGERYGW
ncbi:hypothetical protein DMI70_12710 [Escherichia coli]|nr:hypothetical protein [Escherichia coli]